MKKIKSLTAMYYILYYYPIIHNFKPALEFTTHGIQSTIQTRAIL